MLDVLRLSFLHVIAYNPYSAPSLYLAQFLLVILLPSQTAFYFLPYPFINRQRAFLVVAIRDPLPLSLPPSRFQHPSWWDQTSAFQQGFETILPCYMGADFAGRSFK